MKYPAHALRIMVIGLAACVTGCGTITSRTGQQKYGAYPYQAVGTDVVLLFLPPLTVGAVVSLPFDAVLDTVFLPADLMHWTEGSRKDGFLSGLH